MKSTYHTPPFIIIIIVALSLLASCNQTDMRQDFCDVEECIVKGTYEEAVANGDDTSKWIAGKENAAGKWEFVIPIVEIKKQKILDLI